MGAIHFERIGPAPRIAVNRCGEGPLLVCMHGIGGNRSNWDDQLAAFGRYFTVVAWDARGYGDSDDYTNELKFEDFSADLKRLLDHYGVERAHLMGISMGGRIALDFTAREPQRVASLVLADTSAGSKAMQSEERIEEFLSRRKGPLLLGKTPADIAGDVADSLVGPNTPREVRERLVASLATLHKASYLKTLDVVTRYSHFWSLATIAAPSLVLVGEYDRIATPAYAGELALLLRARFHVVTRAGHMSNMDNPEEFNRTVLSFLLEHRDRGDAPPKPALSSSL